jgi:transcriptional regulator with XRE-family HTH domain
MNLTRTRKIGERIRGSRERHQLTIEDAAARPGALDTPSRLANVEHVVRRPDIEAIAEAFGDVSVGRLPALNGNSSKPGEST